jgi:hypothetical protein
MLSSNQVGEAFGPSRLVYNIRSAGGTNPGGEKYGGRHYRVELEKAKCSCNIHNSSRSIARMSLQLADAGV